MRKKAQLTEKKSVGCALILFVRLKCIILASRLIMDRLSKSVAFASLLNNRGHCIWAAMLPNTSLENAPRHVITGKIVL